MFEHDFKKYPELTKEQMSQFGFMSPHKQIDGDFYATCVKVHDGDTISLKVPWRDFVFPLRFSNIDSKELNAGGDEARDWLKGLIEGQEVFIVINMDNKVEKYGRLLGNVIYRGLDVGEEEINLGIAPPFGQRYEGKLPILNKILDVQQWL